MDLPTATFERIVTPIDFILAEEQAVSPFKVNSSTSRKVATNLFLTDDIVLSITHGDVK